MRSLFAPLALCAASCSASGPASVTLSAENWPEADSLFHADANWLGADGAYSIDLGGGRVLWVFGDSFIALDDTHTRAKSKMVRNSVAIQNGYDPLSATMKFYWAQTSAGPGSFFPEEDTTWFWPGGGVRVGAELLLFQMRVRQVSGGPFGFNVYGYRVLVVRNPDDEPSHWAPEELAAPQNSFGIVVGTASVLSDGTYLEALSDASGGNVALARWSLADVMSGDLSKIAWWSGGQFVPDAQLNAKPDALLDNAPTEFTVHHDAHLNLWLAIQSLGFGGATIAYRTANDLTGPWSSPGTFFHPPEDTRANILIYAGKAHPELQGADLVGTYVANDLDFQTVVADDTLYYPRFLRITYSR